MKADVSLDYQFTSSIEEVWNALTDSDTLAKWIWKNDFKPIVGHKFQFRAEPNEWWDGIVDCEVLEVNEPHSLSYTWASAGESTTVTWTLKKKVQMGLSIYISTKQDLVRKRKLVRVP